MRRGGHHKLCHSHNNGMNSSMLLVTCQNVSGWPETSRLAAKLNSGKANSASVISAINTSSTGCWRGRNNNDDTAYSNLLVCSHCFATWLAS